MSQPQRLLSRWEFCEGFSNVFLRVGGGEDINNRIFYTRGLASECDIPILVMLPYMPRWPQGQTLLLSLNASLELTVSNPESTRLVGDLHALHAVFSVRTKNPFDMVLTTKN